MWCSVSELHFRYSGTHDSFLEFNRRKVSPRKQSSCWGCKVLLANGLGWQHHSSTKALQFSLGRGRTLRNFLTEKKKYFHMLFPKTLTKRLDSLQEGKKKLQHFLQKEVLDSPFSQRYFLWMNSEKAMAKCFLPSLWWSFSHGWIFNDYTAEFGITSL